MNTATFQVGVEESRGFASVPSQRWSGLEFKACNLMKTLIIDDHFVLSTFDDSSASDIPVGDSSLGPSALLGEYPPWASQ